MWADAIQLRHASDFNLFCSYRDGHANASMLGFPLFELWEKSKHTHRFYHEWTCGRCVTGGIIITDLTRIVDGHISHANSLNLD